MKNIETLMMAAAERRASLFELAHTDCFRLINDEADGLGGLVVDRFADFLLVSSYDSRILDRQNGSVVLKKIYMNALLSLANKLPFAVRGILLKNREKLTDRQDFTVERRSQLIEGDYPPDGFNVIQNGVRAYADLIDGQSSGIFLDMREIRANLVNFYSSADCDSMLNLFSYTGIFAVHALKNGMKRAINVDISKSVLKRARENYNLNSLVVDDRDFLYGDSIDWLRRFKKKETSFSLAVIDPPTFARNKAGQFSIRANYSQSLEMLTTVALGGYVFSAVNTASISKAEYMAYHPKNWKLIMYGNESSDFLLPGRPYLKAGLWKV